MNKSAHSIFEDIDSELYEQLPFNYRYARKHHFEGVSEEGARIQISKYNTTKAVSRKCPKPISRIIKRELSE